jgi:hypothetical protein
MSSFPPANWEVRYLQDMDTFQRGARRQQAESSCPASRQAGLSYGRKFQDHTDGTEDVSIRLNVSDFIPYRAMEAFTVVG